MARSAAETLVTLAHAAAWMVLGVNAVHLMRSRRAPARIAHEPTVSVLIPARDEAHNIGRLLESLRTQSYPDFEVIVYDDASTDGTGDIARSFDDDRVRVLEGHGPPQGWVGKVHALFQATREARGNVYLFLDADTELSDERALARLVARWQAVDSASDRGGVLSGLPRLQGGGQLLVSLVPFALNIGLPMPLIPRTKNAGLSSLNGQCWVIGAETYHREEPHAAMPAEVLEDVRIGQLLKRRGCRIELVDLRGEVSVRMYADHREAWRGFRKNVYLLQGGTPIRSLTIQALFAIVFVWGPLRRRSLLVSTWGLKAVSDVASGLSWRVALLAPLSLLSGVLLSIDSAVSHWRRRVEWKERAVSSGVK